MSDFRIIDDEIVEAERFIEATPPADCELCGESRELRPYGPNGEWVCFSCGMQDEEAAKRRFLGELP